MPRFKIHMEVNYEGYEYTYLKPLCFMINCIHQTILNKALSASANQTSTVSQRFAGIQANASALSPEELDNCCELKSDEPKELADKMEVVCYEISRRILGSNSSL